MLFTPQEIQAMLALLNRTPMTPAELLYSQGFFQRLATFCQPATSTRSGPSKPEPEPKVEERPDRKGGEE